MIVKKILELRAISFIMSVSNVLEQKMDKSLKDKYLPQDDVFLFNTGDARKAWLLLGCRYLPEIKMHRFVVWAPNAETVSLVGDFNGWDTNAMPMEKCGTMWVCFVEGLSNGDLYKYCVTQKGGKKVFKSDPFARWSQTGLDTASRVWTGSFKWSDGKYMDRCARRDAFTQPMSIYELHLGSWKSEPDGSVNYVKAAH